MMEFFLSGSLPLIEFVICDMSWLIWQINFSLSLSLSLSLSSVRCESAAECGAYSCSRWSRSGARELFFDWGKGVKITRATCRGIQKSVINDNKNTVLDLVSEYNIKLWCRFRVGVYQKKMFFFQKNLGGQNTMFDPPGQFPGGLPEFPRPWSQFSGSTSTRHRRPASTQSSPAFLHRHLTPPPSSAVILTSASAAA